MFVLRQLENGARLLAEALTARETRLDVLVNNSGVNWGEAIETYPEAAWTKVLSVNVASVFHLTRALIPLLEAASTPVSPARVINIGSIDGIRVPNMETYAYSTSKAAVHHLSRHLAARFGNNEKKITVNTIAPGPFESKMMKATLEKFRDALEGQNPLGRIGGFCYFCCWRMYACFECFVVHL